MKTKIHFIIVSALIFMTRHLSAQTGEPQKFDPAIEDNSMFIEEAYNQEDRVVQHISNLVFLPVDEDNLYYSFTQEWPAFGLKHQLSYTLQYYSFGKAGVSGFGDIYLNYRYQLSYKENFVACSPRLSLVIPTGNHAKRLGDGSWGLQFNLPVSKRWTNHFINHFNVGTTYYFKVEQKEIGFSHSLVSYFAGISSIWLISPKFNLMLECMSYLVANPAAGNKVDYVNESIIAPAFRYAIDIKNLQIVPGISFPVSLSKETGTDFGIFFYLSFEHPY
ncbi:MAG: transporter [Bacteroidota bacterium]